MAKSKYVSERTYQAYPWAMFTVCVKCKEFRYCRGKTRERMMCKECACGNE